MIVASALLPRRETNQLCEVAEQRDVMQSAAFCN